MLKEIRAAVADALQVALPGVQTGEGVYVLSNPTPPFFALVPASVEYDAAMGRGSDWWYLTLSIAVAEVTDIGAQVVLDEMIEPSGAKSVKRALEQTSTSLGGAERTLGGVVDSLRVQTFDGYRQYAREASGPVIGGEWTIQILASGT